MKFYIDPEIIKKLKKQNVIIRKSFRQKMTIFATDPNDPILDNHELQRNYRGYRSIDITDDDKFVAIYEEIQEGKEKVAYFFEIGFKKELYSKKLR